MYNMNETEKMKQDIENLKRMVEELTLKVQQMSELQDDFATVQVVRRDTQFIGKIYDKNGDLALN